MGNEVYANMMEVSCKAAMGKAICAFPDVCFTPPTTPATPPGVPIPYPNTGMASDTTSGSTSVKISSQEVMLKNKSYFKQSYGDEAGCAPKKGVVTSVNRGKVYFTMWSMDVKVEGENVVRNFDLTTHNHNPPPGNTPPWTYLDRMAMAEGVAACDGAKDEVKKKCGDGEKPVCPDAGKITEAEKARDELSAKLKADGLSDSKRYKHKDYIEKQDAVRAAYEDFAKEYRCEDGPGACQKALACFLSPEKPSRCCPKQTPHHLIPASSIVREGSRGKGESPLKEFSGYESKSAPCICAEGPSWHVATHKEAHTAYADYVGSLEESKGTLAYADKSSVAEAQVIKYDDALKGAMESAHALAPHCDPGCIEGQLNKAHFGNHDITKEQRDTPIRRTMDEEKYRSTPETEMI